MAQLKDLIVNGPTRLIGPAYGKISSADTVPVVNSNANLAFNASTTIATVGGVQITAKLPTGGYQGSQGPKGATGNNGSNGSNGSQGPQGPKGATGGNGSNGSQGPQGPKGATGNNGSNGSNGSQGPQGPIGVPNERLAETDTRSTNQVPSWYMTNYGKSIITEFKGTSTIGVNGILTGSYCNLTTITPWGDSSGGLPVQIATNNTSTGKFAYRTSNSAGNGWNAWEVMGAQGPQGPKGATGGSGSAGSQGPQGPKGANGNNGSNGSQGPQGPKGATGSGSQGSQGPQGPKGATGGSGSAGSQGPQGPKGATGGSGSAGSQGPQGPKGAQGPAGSGGGGSSITLGSSTSKAYLLAVTGTSSPVTATVYNSNVYMQSSNLYATSDARLKNFKGDVDIDLDKLASLPKKYFTWKNDKENAKVNIGTSAQELQKVYPELVSTDDNGYLAVSYEKLSVIALAAVDKLHEENNSLKKENDELKERLRKIEEKLGL